MAITDQTRKILWSLSGNQCARCKASLVSAPEAEDDCHAIVGRECHIVARSVGGPRGLDGPRDRIDGHANLILLCANCHAVVDGQPERYPPEALRRLKQDHEAAVARRSTPGLPEVRLTGRGVPVRLSLVESGDRLIGIVGPSLSLRYETPDQLRSEVRAALGQFLQDCADWGDIVGDLGPKGYFDAAESLQGHLDELRALGFVVYAGSQRLTLQGGTSPPHAWPEAVIKVIATDGLDADAARPEAACPPSREA